MAAAESSSAPPPCDEGWAGPFLGPNLRILESAQVKRLNESYSGGLSSYICKAKKLFQDSRAGINLFTRYVPSVPVYETLHHGDPTCMKYERTGVAAAKYTAFVLVAGGLGERLGYSGIKIDNRFLQKLEDGLHTQIALPAETTTGTCFLKLYIDNILALQKASNKGTTEGPFRIPFVIMTSDNTHQQTEDLLTENHFFGMQRGQVQLLKQENVACLSDSDARLALDPADNFLIQAIPASLGVSASYDLDVNSLAIRRKAKERIGGIAKLTHENGSETVISVEYNQLDLLLRATGHPDGNVNDQTGFSPYPGNVNQLVLKLSSYIEELSKTNGTIVELVNPKYKDAGKTILKSSARLECMMQDYPRSLPSSAKVGVTVMDTWLAYAPVKNSPENAQKIPSGNPSNSATSGEMAIYEANYRILNKAPAISVEPIRRTFNGQDVDVWPNVVWSPKWALTLADVHSKIKRFCHMSPKSTLILDGEDITLDDLILDGALVVRAHDTSICRIVSVTVSDEGWKLVPVEYTNQSCSEEIRLCGFRFEHVGQHNISCEDPGMCSVRRVRL